MFYNGVFELFECFIIDFANTRSDFRAKIECFILEFSCISMHVISLLHLTFVLSRVPPELSLLVYHYKIWSFVAIQKTKMNGPN